MERDLTSRTLPVRMVPFFWTKSEGTWLPDIPNERLFDAGAGIDIEYEVRNLRLSIVEPSKKARSEQLRSATLVAFSLLVYTVLWDIVQRLKKTDEGVEGVEGAGGGERLAMTIVRLQHAGRRKIREDDAHDGNTAVYAVSQAIERAMCRELPVKLQGIATLAERRRPSDDDFAKTGSLAALLGGQPMRFRMEGTLDKVAVLTYVTKPSDALIDETQAPHQRRLYVEQASVEPRFHARPVLGQEPCLHQRGEHAALDQDFVGLPPENGLIPERRAVGGHGAHARSLWKTRVAWASTDDSER